MGCDPITVLGESPNPCTLNAECRTGGDATHCISDATSLYSAPGSLQYTSFECAASPHTTRPLSNVPEGHPTSLSNPLTSFTHGENMLHDAHVDNDATGITMPVGHGAESLVKAEERPWFTIRHDRCHTCSTLCLSANLPDHSQGGCVPSLGKSWPRSSKPRRA